MKIRIEVILLIVLLTVTYCMRKSTEIQKRALQKSHEKPQIVKWTEKILENTFKNYSDTYSINQLLLEIANQYLLKCSTVLFYQHNFVFLVDSLLERYPNTFALGKISDNYKIINPQLYANIDNQCQNFIFFLHDIMEAYKVLMQRYHEKILIVTQSSQWKIYEFLSSTLSHRFVNLLVISMNDEATTRNQVCAHEQNSFRIGFRLENKAHSKMYVTYFLKYKWLSDLVYNF